MIHVAIIGLGAVTRNLHLPAYAKLPGVEIAAGCDPDPAARNSAQRQWGIPKTFDTAAAMLQQVQPDVVSICTPPASHRDLSILALDHGCHVFCEKPLAEDLCQADDIIAAAERAQRLVVVNNQFPRMNIYTESKRLIGSPQFGRLLFLHAWQTFNPTEHTEASWRGELQRRLCFEFGVHVFELIRFFFEENPVRIMAHMPNPLHSQRCDTVNVIALEFADGRAASIVLDRLSKGPDRYLDLRLDGESGSIHTTIGGRLSLHAGIHTRERRPYLEFKLVKGGEAVLQHGTRAKVIARDPINPFAFATRRQFDNLLHAIEHGGTPPGNAVDNRNTLALVLAAYDSAASAKWAEVAQYLRRRVAV